MTPNGVAVAVEVDGPTRLASNFPHRELGKTKLKRRLLQDRGLTVVNVPYLTWDSLRNSREHVAYLKRLFGQQLGVRHSGF